MKQKWIRPQTTIEKFVPNEYIAACYNLQCDTATSNLWEQQHNYYGWKPEDLFHSGDGCGNMANQVIVDRNNDNIPERIYEIKKDGLGGGRLDCTIMDASFTNQLSYNSININGPIYWITKADDGREWHHTGHAIKQDVGAS